MQKKHLICLSCLLCLCIFLPMAAASAGTYYTHEDQQAYALACLTEVYGYTAPEAAKFEYAFEEADGIATVRFWHAEHPEWVYRCTFSLTDGKRLKSETPFASDDPVYPGENSVRAFVTNVVGEGLLTNWNKEARQEFGMLLENEDIKPCFQLEKGLLSATYTAPEALHDFFVSCYGDDTGWPEAVTQWYQWLIEQNQLPAGEGGNPAQGITRYRLEGFNPYVLTEFNGATPPELADALRHPMLEGWTLLNGVTVIYEESENSPAPDGNGLIALQKGDECCLCILFNPSENNPEKAWTVLPTCQEALPDNCSPVISVTDAYGLAGLYYSVSFTTEDYGKAELIWKRTAHNESRYPTLQLETCKLTQPDGTILEAGHTGLEEVYLTRYVSGIENSAGRINSLLPFDINYLNGESLLYAITHPDENIGFVLPDDAAYISSVHLRKETSSHSKDLGTFNSGVIARYLGTESGDPYPWLHVRIGGLEGYMSSVYAGETPGRSFHTPLPVATVSEPVKLRESTVPFSKTVTQLEPGTTLHILSNMGRWCYVCVPNTQPAGMWMDIDGTYGYVKTKQLTTVGTARQLEWQLALESAAEQ